MKKNKSDISFHFIIALVFSLVFPHSLVFAILDLEGLAEDFVLETKKIDLPGHPSAFNPSIIRWNGTLLMVFREIPDPLQNFNSRLGLVFLDDNFNPISKPQILLPEDHLINHTPTRSEDARLISVGDRLYIVYSDNRDEMISKGGFRVYLAELEYDGTYFTAHRTECLTNFEGESKQKREKNWVPFVYDEQLLLAYSLSPHMIFRPLWSSGSCETFSLSVADIKWDWGVLRGGTPGLVVDGQYLAFFHSSQDMLTTVSNGRTIAHYFMGAYTYSLEPPFTITKISPIPIIGKGFYNGIYYKPYWKSVRVVFPGGYIFDDEYIWIAYGRQDHEIWVVKLEKKGLLDSLVPASSK